MLVGHARMTTKIFASFRSLYVLVSSAGFEIQVLTCGSNVLCIGRISFCLVRIESVSLGTAGHKNKTSMAIIIHLELRR